MPLRIAIPDMISPSYFPVIAAVELDLLSEAGVEADVELLFPVTATYAALRDGDVDYVGGAAHAALYAFDQWQGCKLLCALSQHMYWFLVVRADLDAEHGDLHALRGLRIGAAPGPVDGLRRMLASVGLDPDVDLDIGPIPAASGAGASFGVSAARALEDGHVDGFWANGMGAEVAVRTGTGRVLVDARRGDGPAGAQGYTFAALVTTDRRIAEAPEEVAAVTRGVIAAQRVLAADPSRATDAARARFPEHETSLIASLIERDAPFYDPGIDEAAVTSMHGFTRELGLLSTDVAYDDVVATFLRSEWTR